jgi:Rrf2 family protein
LIFIDRQTDYALRGLIYLAGCKKSGWLSTSTLSRQLKVSRVFLARIFQRLASGGLLETQRGAGGGIRLKNKKLSLGHLLKVIEPDLVLNRCLGRGFNCFRKKYCRLHKLLGKLQKELFGKLAQVKLEQLVDRNSLGSRV